ncbi:MAG TPA: CHASE3 domain-containing protein [Tepidisphaeraceae bacterium]|nr:CHASE3 domain-containing protein [Tepidisphaeraceae bacterium]
MAKTETMNHGRPGVTVVFLAAAALLVVSILFTYVAGNIALQSNIELTNKQAILQRLEQFLSTIKDAETGQRGYLLTGEEPYLDPYNKSQASVRGQLEGLRSLAEAGELPAEPVAKLIEAVGGKLAELESTIKVRREQGAEAANTLVRSNQGKQLMDSIRDQVGLIESREQVEFKAATDQLRWATLARNTVFVLTALANLTFLVWAYRRLAGAIAQREAAIDERELQREWLSVTLASIGDAVIVTNMRGQIDFINAEAQRLTGWTADSATGQPLSTVFRIVNESTRLPVENPVEKVLRLGMVVGLANHTILISKDGTETPIDDSGAPIRRVGGEIRGVVLVFRDFSQHKITETMLRQRELELTRLNQRLLALMNAVPVGVSFSNDTTCQDIKGNPAVMAQFEIKPEDNLSASAADPNEAGRKFRYFMDGRPIDADSLPLQRAVRENREISPMELEVILPTGKRWFAQASGAPLRDENGAVIGGVAVTVDITDRKLAEEALRAACDAAEAARAEAEAATRAKDHFIAMLSHELRTPLTPVTAVVGMLESHPRLPDELREDVGMIRRNVALETRLIDDLLDLTRIRQGKLELDLQPVDVVQLVHQTAEIFTAEMETRQLQFRVHADQSPLMVMADSTRLQQIFWNLIKNAIKFCPDCAHIDVRCSVDNQNHAVIEVIDTGIGIEADMLERLFQPFEQGERTITRQFGGLGLGLSISKVLVDLHGGTIKAHSDGRGKGATFTVSLPLTSAKPMAKSPVSSAADQEQLHKSDGRFSILLVEDHDDTVDVMSRLLQASGHDVQIARNVKEAIAHVRQRKFDLVVSDMGLPDGSGLDLMRQARSIHADLKGIALSGYGTEEDIRKSKEAGFYEHLTKPVNFTRLNEVIALAGVDGIGNRPTNDH